MKHQTLICVYGYLVDGGMLKGRVELKLDEPAVTLFLQGVIAVLCLFVALYQGVISADIFILVDSLYRIFVDALLDEACDHIHLLEEFLAFGVNRSCFHQLVTDKPAVPKECLAIHKQLT